MPRSIEKSDRALLEAISRRGGLSVSEMAAELNVTATAVRQRLERLVAGEILDRIEERHAAGGRGRPTYKYVLTDAGKEALGNNMVDLARVLWSEINTLDDPTVRQRILDGVSRRMAALYQSEVSGATVEERMESLAACLRDRDVMVSVEREGDQKLPVLKINGCPYPGLAGHNQHDICDVEQELFSDVLGCDMKLTECKCHSKEGNCTFVASLSPRESTTETGQEAVN